MVTRKEITDDSPFQATKRLLSIGASSTGYTFKHNPAYVPGSAIVEAEWFVYDPTGGDGTVASGDSLVVETVPNDFYRLVGNVGTVYMQ